MLNHLCFITWMRIWTWNPVLRKVPPCGKWPVLAILGSQHLLNHLVCSPEHVRYRIRHYSWWCFDWGANLWRKGSILFPSGEKEANLAEHYIMYASTKDSKERQNITDNAKVLSLAMKPYSTSLSAFRSRLLLHDSHNEVELSWAWLFNCPRRS